MDALKNKNTSSKTGSQLSIEPKRARIEPSTAPSTLNDGSEEDEHEIMALLEEIDRINPSASFSLNSNSNKAAGNVNEPRATKTSLSSLTHFLSSEPNNDDNDEGEVDVRGGESVSIKNDLMHGANFDAKNNQRHGVIKLPGPIKSSFPLPVGKIVSNPPPVPVNDYQNYLAYPFFPESFTNADWSRNVDELSRRPSLVSFLQRRLLLSQVRSMRPGEKCSCLLVMLKEQCIHARDVAVVLFDESGEMTATIHEKVVNNRDRIRLHFGMTLLLTDLSVFAMPTPTASDQHLIVTPENVVRIFSNLHHV